MNLARRVPLARAAPAMLSGLPMPLFMTLLLSLLICLLPGSVAAQAEVPPLVSHITDQTGTLSPAQKTSLEQLLSEFEARKGSQIAVLMVASTQPEAIEQYALRVAEQWKLGRKKVDDGVVLLVAKNDRTMRIEVGYGLEGALSDITSKRIIEEIMAPHFKRQDFYGGIHAGVSQIMLVIDGEPLPAPRQGHSNQEDELRNYGSLLFIIALGVGSVLRVVLGRGFGALITGGLMGLLAWFIIGTLWGVLMAGLASWLITLLGAGNLARMGAYYYGSGGRGGGGFGGGGGSFGGGGASGKW